MGKLVPKIRFNEYKNTFINKQVKDMFDVITRGQVLSINNITKNITDKKIYPVYSSQTQDGGLLGYYDKFLFENAITWTTDGANAGTVNYRKCKFYCTNVCGVLISSTGYANKMVAEKLNLEAYKHVSKVGNPKLMNNVMKDIEISVPEDINEQIRIGDFIICIDKTIDDAETKLNKLKEIKKTILYKMFPQNGKKGPEIRLKGFNGDWEEKTINDIAKVYDGMHQTPDYKNQGIRFVSVENINNLKKSNKFISVEEYDKNYVNNRPKKGDVLMTRIGDIGTTCVIDFDEDLAYYVTLALLKPNNVDSYFLSYLLLTKSSNDEIMSHALVSAIPQKINKNEIGLCKVLVPNDIDEQKAIGEYFNKYDNMIDEYSQKISKIKELKKTLLNKMFV